MDPAIEYKIRWSMRSQPTSRRQRARQDNQTDRVRAGLTPPPSGHQYEYRKKEACQIDDSSAGLHSPGHTADMKQPPQWLRKSKPVLARLTHPPEVHSDSGRKDAARKRQRHPTAQ